jgi:hypothetical protein
VAPKRNGVELNLPPAGALRQVFPAVHRQPWTPPYRLHSQLTSCYQRSFAA